MHPCAAVTARAVDVKPGPQSFDIDRHIASIQARCKRLQPLPQLGAAAMTSEPQRATCPLLGLPIRLAGYRANAWNTYNTCTLVCEVCETKHARIDGSSEAGAALIFSVALRACKACSHIQYILWKSWPTPAQLSSWLERQTSDVATRTTAAITNGWWGKRWALHMAVQQHYSNERWSQGSQELRR